jgi:hypothetical protein
LLIGVYRDGVQMHVGAVRELMGGTGNALPVLHSNNWGLDIFSSFGLAIAWSQLLAIRMLLVPIGVGVGIGIGIDSDCVLWLVLTHGVASLP